MDDWFGSVEVQRGASIIELLVGIAVGLIVVTGAVKLMSETMGSNRRLLLETRVNQDLRAAADLIVHDIRRAGYWNNAASGVFSTNGVPATPNPYRNIDLTSNVIRYTFARDNNNTVESAEWAGYQVTNGVLEMLVSRTDSGGSVSEDWRQLTDPKVVTITTLTIAPLATPRTVELFTYCSCMTKLTCIADQFHETNPLPTGVPRFWSSRPRLTIRQFDVVLAGQAVNDPSVRREIRESVRVRNDQLDGNCPAV